MAKVMGADASGLARHLDHAMESTWLAAILATPLVFSPHAGDPFELQKVVLLRSLAVLALAIWILRWLAGRGASSHAVGGGSKWHGRHRWVVLGLAHLVVLAISTAVSVHGRSSLFGSSFRYQGLVTEASYVLFFVLLLRWLTRRQMLERLVEAALVASLPVALYGVVQRFGTDPVSWSGDVTARVTSSLGNPIFLGGFLVLVIPLTLYRHVHAARELAGRESAALKSVLLVGSSLSLVVQVAAWSFGPVSGTLAAIVTLVFWWREAKLLGTPARPAVVLGAYNVLLAAQLAALLLSGSRGPLLGLAAGLGFLLLLWSVGQRRPGLTLGILGLGAAGAVTLAVANAPSSPLGSVRELPHVGRLGQLLDRTGRVRVRIWEAAGRAFVNEPERLWMGFGPETLHLVATPHFEPEPGGRPRGALPDRAHNESIERLVTSGVAGLAVHFLWVTGLVACGLRSARALSRDTLPAFLALWVTGGAAGALLARALDGSWRLAGPAVFLGMLAGVGIYLGRFALASLGKKAGARGWSSRRWLAAALTSALVAHYVELQFGIDVTATRLYSFVLAACLVAAAGLSRSRERPPGPDLPHGGSLVALVLASLVYSLLAWAPERSLEPSVLWLFGSTWILGSIVVAGGRPAESLRAPLTRYALWTLVPSLFLFALQHAWIADGAEVPEPYWAFVILWIAATAAVRAPRPRKVPMAATLAHGMILVVALALVFGPVLDTVRADVDYGQARLRRLAGELEGAERAARRAITRRPNHDLYLFELGRILLGRASPAGGRARLAESVELLERARVLSPLDPRPVAALSRVYTAWADETRDPEVRSARLEQALELSDEAIARFPANPNFWNDRATILLRAGDKRAAFEALSRSLELDDRVIETYLRLGKLHRSEGALEQAATTYERAHSKAPGSVEVLRSLASVYVELERANAAVEALERLLGLRPDDSAAHLDLALLLDARGDHEGARRHAELAVRYARPGEREAIAALVSSMLHPE